MVILPDYVTLWNSATLNTAQAAMIDYFFHKAIALQAKFEKVEIETGIPWWLIGFICGRETAFDFTRCLHNGDRCIGNGLKTVRVPAGRGPFPTWESAAIDAIKYKFPNPPRKMTISKALELGERWNGLGYVAYHPTVNDPYLWSGTNLYTSGKYQSDGKWDKDLADAQCGLAAFMMKLSDAGMLESLIAA